jgi:hypothetical protein
MPQSHFSQEDLTKIRKLATMLSQCGRGSTFNGCKTDVAAASLRKGIVILEEYLNDEDERGIHPDNDPGHVQATTPE